MDLTKYENHTKGGWGRNIPPARKYAVVYAGRNTHVAVVCSQGLTDEEIEANCNLIADAPRLLAEVARLQALLDSGSQAAPRDS